ncbi:unnamed protein product [Nezara viridula]|uniref:Uncharacterized protein n=1 Tax=Nezara viridula TaxID=85310 RepID=A0A9P0HEF0_NEZVI|nr:unnamed protein product [Nezara viridula]
MFFKICIYSVWLKLQSSSTRYNQQCLHFNHENKDIKICVNGLEKVMIIIHEAIATKCFLT